MLWQRGVRFPNRSIPSRAGRAVPCVLALLTFVHLSSGAPLSLAAAADEATGEPDGFVGPVPRATLLRATPLVLPRPADSNSPVVWGDADGLGRIHVLTSVAGAPSLSIGARLGDLRVEAPLTIQGTSGGVWIEAVVPDDQGRWYGFYHNEVTAQSCGDPTRMSPRVGALRSDDEGRSWQDLGVILALPEQFARCDTRNRYFNGGVGDFSVALDANASDLYIFYSQYPAQLEAQGVAVARLLWADRDAPVGRVSVWQSGVWMPAERVPGGDEENPDDDGWHYPVATPILPAQDSWHDENEEVDAFWGPSVHWNTSVRAWVMLLNRASDVEWTQEGVYVAYARSLEDPRRWSPPQKLLDGGNWYPQVIGLEQGQGTDKLAGPVARFFMSGTSNYLIRFSE